MVAQAKNKSQWIHHYANQIFELYLRLQHPLDISANYKHQIERDLENFYREPLKRSLIEMTY